MTISKTSDERNLRIIDPTVALRDQALFFDNAVTHSNWPGQENEHAQNIILGSGIVSMVSLFERIIESIHCIPPHCKPSSPLYNKNRVNTVEYLHEKYSIRNGNGVWGKWFELDGLFRIRHCFAHKDGEVLPRHKCRISKLRKTLNNNDSTTELIPYFDLVEEEIIIKDINRMLDDYPNNNTQVIKYIKLNKNAIDYSYQLLKSALVHCDIILDKDPLEIQQINQT